MIVNFISYILRGNTELRMQFVLHLCTEGTRSLFLNNDRVMLGKSRVNVKSLIYPFIEKYFFQML